jgi:hypothetical protein
MKPRRERPPFLTLEAADVAEGGAPGFLGRFEETALRAELRRAGILQALAARGYEDLVLVTSVTGGEHRLSLRPARGRLDLVDLRVRESTLVVKEQLLRARVGELLSVLNNAWLSLQDPRARFTPQRPRLPGQRHPGLGLSKAFFLLLTGWAREWGKDALINTPEYLHNAIFYERGFQFLSPIDQGRFEALRRDLGALPVAVASAAVAEGRARDAATGRVWRWRGPMAAALTAPLRSYLVSAEYRQAAEAWRAAARFSVTPQS